MHSSNANIYRRIPVKAGVHTLKARLKDRPGDDFNYVSEETMTLCRGASSVIDFAATGGFIFKNKNANQDNKMSSTYQHAVAEQGADATGEENHRGGFAFPCRRQPAANWLLAGCGSALHP